MATYGPGRRSPRRARPLALLFLALSLAGAGCAPVAPAAAPSAPRLYVADAAAGHVIVLDPATGRALSPPLPAGPAPEELAAGPPGTVIVRSMAPDPGDRIGLLWSSPTAPVTAGTVPLPVGLPVRHARLAGDGARYAAVAASPPASPSAHVAGGAPRAGAGCRLALLDVPAREVRATHRVCEPGELVAGLALEAATTGDGGPRAYVAVRTWPAGGGGSGVGAGRILALDAASGAPAAVLPLVGAPVSLLLAPSPDSDLRGGGRCLYVVEALAGPESEPPAPYRGRLLALDPTTLAVEATVPLDAPVTRLAVAPDGDRAYALLGHTLLEIDPRTGRAAALATLPGGGLGVAAGRERVFVGAADGGVVWSVERRRPAPASGAPAVRTHPLGGAGARPVALLLSDPGGPRD
jgi:DNA-binding beta-propeller fold protein YncE